MKLSPSALSVAVAATLTAPFSAHSALVDNLKGYWSFEEDYSDQSGNGYTGTPGGTGASTILSASTFGRVGDSAQFNGNQYVFLPITYGVLPNDPATPTMLGQNFTISSWYYLTGTATGSTRYFLYENDQPGSSADINRYTLSYEIRSDIGLGNFAGSSTVGVNPSDNSINLSRFAGAAPTVDGQPTWVNLVQTYTATVDGTGANITTVTTYFNGVPLSAPGLPDATNQPQIQQTSIIFEGSGLNIGTYRDANGRWWKGYIDEVAVWDRVLTDAEIGQVYNLGTNGQSIPEPGAGLLMTAGVVALGAFRRHRGSRGEKAAA